MLAVVEEPEFTEYIENVTVPAGRNVKLGCSVKNLGSYKVSRLWLNFNIFMFLIENNVNIPIDMKAPIMSYD